MNRRLFYTHPCRQMPAFFSSRQGMIRTALSNTASNSTYSIASSTSSGRMTLLTRKCFCFWTGWTAVHLLSRSFLGFRGFCCSEGIALEFRLVADEVAGTRRKNFSRLLNDGRTFQIKIANGAQTAAVIKLLILKLHLRLFKNHLRLFSWWIDTGPSGIGFSLATQKTDDQDQGGDKFA